jgi:hypothetical protein
LVLVVWVAADLLLEYLDLRQYFLQSYLRVVVEEEVLLIPDLMVVPEVVEVDSEIEEMVQINQLQQQFQNKDMMVVLVAAAAVAQVVLE